MKLVTRKTSYLAHWLLKNYIMLIALRQSLKKASIMEAFSGTPVGWKIVTYTMKISILGL